MTATTSTSSDNRRGNPEPPPLTLLKLMCDSIPARCIHVAGQLGIADHLGDEGRSLADLATVTGTHAPSLRRLLQALTRVGVFAEIEPGWFANSELSSCLRGDSAGSMRSMAQLAASEWQWQCLGKMEYSVRTGRPATEATHGVSLWRYLTEEDPEAGAVFNQAMTGFSVSVDEPIARSYDLSEARTIVDVGGGHGNLLRTLLATYPHVERGVLFDQPHVTQGAAETLATAIEVGRAELVGGDFFAGVPAGADVYFMKQILQDWEDEDCMTILSNCRRAMNSGGRIVSAELVLRPESDSFAWFLDILMLAVVTGRQRTEEELAHLFAAAGLRLTRVIPTGSMFSAVEAVAVP